MNLFLLFFTVLSLKVKVCPEYELSKSHDKGPVDWIIKIGDTIIIITESKREDINQDVSQNAIQLQVLSQRNKKKRTYNEALRENVMYDIVLIGVNWIIIKLVTTSECMTMIIKMLRFVNTIYFSY